ncbi:MAG: 16S rRNA (adenine(1518)-N(6)/adenine(1519)-N(6))-dimethyltransferase RsmA [Solirubrobacterales bacterium]
MGRLGQNFLADSNLLDAIVEGAGILADDVVLEVGGGEGVLTRRLAERAARVYVIELDRRLADPLGALAADAGNVELLWGDAMRLDLAGLDPSPTRMVANLPYSIATPLLLRTVAELPAVAAWTVMVQREIADRLRAAPGSRTYGAPSVLVQIACEVKLLRAVDPAVFTPRPRVESALLGMRRTGPGADPGVARLVRAAFAHRRKTLAASVELAGLASRRQARVALEHAGLDPAARAEALAPGEFLRLAGRLDSG